MSVKIALVYTLLILFSGIQQVVPLFRFLQNLNPKVRLAYVS